MNEKKKQKIEITELFNRAEFKVSHIDLDGEDKDRDKVICVYVEDDKLIKIRDWQTKLLATKGFRLAQIYTEYPLTIHFYKYIEVEE